MQTYDNREESYLGKALRDPHKLIRNAKKALKDVDFDTFIGTGVSGTLAVGMLSVVFPNKNFAIVRKDESSHSPFMVEGSIGEKWIFVDDFISSGATLRRTMKQIVNAVTEAKGWGKIKFPEYVGTFLYEVDGGRFQTADRRSAVEEFYREMIVQ